MNCLCYGGIMLNKNFILGGNATFTVQNPSGKYYTFKVRQPKSDMPHFLSLLTGPDNENSFTYVGVVKADLGQVFLTGKSKLANDSLPVKVARFALRCVWGQQVLPEGYQIRHEGKCGCCGRTLTTPESLDRGIGPECIKKFA